MRSTSLRTLLQQYTGKNDRTQIHHYFATETDGRFASLEARSPHRGAHTNALVKYAVLEATQGMQV